MTEKPLIAIGSSFEIPPGSNLGNIQEDFKKLERNQEKANNFIMWMTGIIAGVFFVTGTVIVIDYAFNRGETYEKFVDKTTEIQKDFYSKDDLKPLFIDNTKNSKILECLKIKGYFSIQCF